jgi:hypothetical protein
MRLGAIKGPLKLKKVQEGIFESAEQSEYAVGVLPGGVKEIGLGAPDCLKIPFKILVNSKPNLELRCASWYRKLFVSVSTII